MKNLSEELITRADIAKSELMNLGTDQCKLSNTMNRERERETLKMIGTSEACRTIKHCLACQ